MLVAGETIEFGPDRAHRVLTLVLVVTGMDRDKGCSDFPAVFSQY
jgi:hypothetical protein